MCANNRTHRLLCLAAISLGATSVVLGQQQRIVVDLAALLAHPNVFEEKLVEVTGYLNRNLGVQIFVEKNYADAGDYEYAVEIADYQWFEIYDSPCVGYVKIRATVFIEEKVALLSDVETIRQADSDQVCWGSDATE